MIEARLKNEFVEIDITDHGAGITEKDYSKIFDPFFTTKEEGQGTGLGLSISYGIVQRHDGSLTLQNTNHGGVKVRICLPRTQSENVIEEESLEELHVG
jgi:signal transduction histidine kinase